MSRTFNVTGTCIPEEDYMVDLTDKLNEIKLMIDNREYFTINRGRQYGKTTMLNQLERFLVNEYKVISISFEGFSQATFSSESKFCKEFLLTIHETLELAGASHDEVMNWKNDEVDDFKSLGRQIRHVCRESDVPYVLMIDEVDKASNHLVFLDFLGKLREKFLARRIGKDFTFHSVILAGVHDIKNIKLKMIQEGVYIPTKNEASNHNSPWNIATQFLVEMSFSQSEISGMLNKYEADNHTGMNITEISKEIYDYTGGYPVLVSSICKYIDERLEKDWTTSGVRRGVKLVLKEESPLFDNLIKNLGNNKHLSELLLSMIIDGRKWSFNPDDEMITLGIRYGYLKEEKGKLEIFNQIFKVRLLNYFTTRKERETLYQTRSTSIDETGIIVGDHFNMVMCLEKFSEYFLKFYSQKDEAFIEREGRLLFLMFISPVLNGQGFAYIEAQSPDGKRTDVIVNYLSEQFIVELKIWDGAKKHEEAKVQLLSYMERFKKSEGYLLTFNFNKKKEPRSEWITLDGKKIFDVML